MLTIPPADPAVLLTTVPVFVARVNPPEVAICFTPETMVLTPATAEKNYVGLLLLVLFYDEVLLILLIRHVMVG